MLYFEKRDWRSKVRIAKQLDEAMHKTNFFYVTQHNVNRELIDQTYAVARSFFGGNHTYKQQFANAKHDMLDAASSFKKNGGSVDKEDKQNNHKGSVCDQITDRVPDLVECFQYMFLHSQHIR